MSAKVGERIGFSCTIDPIYYAPPHIRAATGNVAAEGSASLLFADVDIAVVS